MKINKDTIDSNSPPYIIAEMSANHNSSIENAKKIISLAKKNGASAVKMQTYTPDTITLNSDNDEFMIKEGLWKEKIYMNFTLRLIPLGNGMKNYLHMHKS